jgi:hypothetical protein
VTVECQGKVAGLRGTIFEITVEGHRLQRCWYYWLAAGEGHRSVDSGHRRVCPISSSAWEHCGNKDESNWVYQSQERPNWCWFGLEMRMSVG